jgi:RNA polymerase sigma-70 factor (ECF subfamily)
MEQRLLNAVDPQLMRDRISVLLAEKDSYIIEACRFSDALKTARAFKPDIIILGGVKSNEELYACAETLHKEYPQTQIIAECTACEYALAVGMRGLGVITLCVLNKKRLFAALDNCVGTGSRSLRDKRACPDESGNQSICRRILYERNKIRESETDLRRRSDEDLMCALQEGHKNAWAELYLRHRADAMRIARRFTHCKEDVEDAVMFAFKRIRTRAKYYRAGMPFMPFFYRIVANVCLNMIKRNKRIEMVSMEDADYLPDTDADPFENFRRTESETILNDALNALPEQQRMAVILKYIEGKSYKEIAEIMQTTPNYVGRLLYKSRTCLKELFETQ